ncbi:MAG: hypothetical protein HY908_03585, partial [Myxococcales bacterium]|nr:hypothetical protein [Myxococcales bacterium]
MAIDHVRHLRQLLLAGWGGAGQERVGGAVAAVARVPGGAALAHEVAELYAARAGFAGLEPGSIDMAGLAPVALVARRAPREVLAG